MVEPTQASFYVTLVSNGGKQGEFPFNQPCCFKNRLPQALLLRGPWKVGLASLYLPGAPHPTEPVHVVTSHPVVHPTKPTAPITEHRQRNLYRGSATTKLFTMLGRAEKAVDGSSKQEIISNLNKLDIPSATTGVEFMRKVTAWLFREQFKKLPVGFRFGTSTYNDMPKFTWKDDRGGMPVLRLDSYGMGGGGSDKTQPFFGVNLVLAENMGWVVPTDVTGVYDIGPNLVVSTRSHSARNEKEDPDLDKTSLFTFTKPVHAHQGIVYFSCIYDYDFFKLNEAYEYATTHVYLPPKVLNNAFKWIMDDGATWSADGGIGSGNAFETLEMSPHYWNKKVRALVLTKNNNQYQPIFSWAMNRMTKGQWYRMVVEMYQTDKWLFDHTTVSVSNARAYSTWIADSAVTKHVHEYNGTHMLYYHRLAINFRNLNESYARVFRVQVTATITSVPASYPATLEGGFFVVVYGYPIAEPLPRLDSIEDVYGGHPVLPTSRATTSTSTTTETTTSPTHSGSSVMQKKTTVMPVTHGSDVTRPLHVYCNLGQSMIVNNQTIDLLRQVEYKNEKALVEPEHMQLHPLRTEILDIAEVAITEWDGRSVTFNEDTPVICTLFFTKDWLV